MALKGTLYDFEMQKFIESSSRPGKAIPEISVLASFSPPASADYIGRSVAANVETFVYKSGGASGTLLKTITVTYVGTDLEDLVSVSVA